MAYVLDLAVILVFGLMVFIGYKRGVIKSLTRLIGLVAAVVVAISFSGPAANAIYEKYVGPAVEEAVEERIDETAHTGETALRDGVESVLEALPAPLLNLMKNNNVGTVDEVMSKVDADGDQSRFNAGELAETLTAQIVQPVAVTVLRLIAFLVILLVAVLLALVLSGLIGKLVEKIPFVSGLNNSLGALFGALEGVALVLVLVAVVQLVASMEAVDWLTQEHIDHTILTGSISQVNPVSRFFQSVLLTFAE